MADVSAVVVRLLIDPRFRLAMGPLPGGDPCMFSGGAFIAVDSDDPKTVAESPGFQVTGVDVNIVLVSSIPFFYSFELYSRRINEVVISDETAAEVSSVLSIFRTKLEEERGDPVKWQEIEALVCSSGFQAIGEFLAAAGWLESVFSVECAEV
jgi:hypothetical protein